MLTIQNFGTVILPTRKKRNQFQQRLECSQLIHLLASLASFGVCDITELRCFLLISALSLHFLKRDLEVLFVHRYSGLMGLQTTIFISVSYLVFATTLIYAQNLARGNPEPTLDLKNAGVFLFSIGTSGNFYHHFLLSKLRQKNDTGYKIPKGGLFNYVTCPHYLFEIISFIGLGCISQTVYGVNLSLGILCYLSGRSFATREWYRSKFENFPANTKALIPCVFQISGTIKHLMQ